jgi:hypothetical protein
VAKKSTTPVQNLLDAVRPAEADGPLRSAVLSTYGLSLDQPNFFEHDFLPTLLGLGGVRDRGYVAPVTLERKLAETYCALICDAHALAEGARPSLRVDVIPISRPRHHAKITFIHRQRLVRVIISSANLTHDGYRSQREAAAVLDFRPDGGLPWSILDGLARGWMETLGDAATGPVRSAVDNAVAVARSWPVRPVKGTSPVIRVVFGGGQSPLWRQLADAWPQGEPVLSWRICSPFWPGTDSHTTPFESIADALRQRGASLEKTEIEVICPADVAGERARPVFPFALLRGLRARGFPVTRGRLVPARLETLDDEVPDRKAEGHRALHAKCVLLRGPETAVALLGSGNFTNPGLGVSARANIEAGVLITCPAAMVRENDWRPPLVEAGAVDWATCASHALMAPTTQPDDPIDWPAHLRRLDLDIHWGGGPDPSGTLLLTFVAEPFTPTVLLIPGDKSEPTAGELARIEAYPESNGGVVTVPVDPAEVRRLLVRRTVAVRWGEPARSAAYPINVLDTAKAGLPSVLGARPDEQQLLAYFHGRIGEDDLLALLEQRAQQLAEDVGAGTSEGPSADLQNYLIREFVESLYGLEDTLKTALYSPRALESALLGEFSPAALAERVLTALRAGRRSGTAAAFQLAELVRVVSGLPLATSDADPKALAEVSHRAVDRLLALTAQAAQVPSFSGTLRETHFAAFVRASLPRELAPRFLAAAGEFQPSTGAPHTEASHAPAP